MYKSLILNKIQAVLLSRVSGIKHKVLKISLLFTSIIGLGERPQPKCKDCKKIGHYNKNYYKCKLFKEDKADDGE
jgi:hypothetical protein